jgi:Asp-tRNA(Asn)/Glu-tRNA(Gln) amidotransferase B subunit
MRVDVNLEIHDATSLLKTPSIQIKNVSDRAKNVQRAIEYEYRRLVTILESGGEVEA